MNLTERQKRLIIIALRVLKNANFLIGLYYGGDMQDDLTNDNELILATINELSDSLPG